MARDRAVPALDDLVQVDAVVECRERLLGVGADLRQPQRRAELELGDADACRRESRECVGGVLELHRAVADVVADAEMAPQRLARLRRARGRSPRRRSRRSRRCAGDRERTRASPRSSRGSSRAPARARARFRGRCGAAASTSVAACRAIMSAMARGASGRRRRDRLEGSRHGRHRARHSFGKQRGEDLGGLVGVGQPLGREPVGLVDVLLHARPMKGAIGKRIDREDVEIVPRQKRAQLVERRGLAQCLRRDRREPQAEPERRVGRDRGLDARQVRFEAVAHLVPALSRMDVGAVGEMDITGKMIEPHDRLPKAVSIAP